MKIIRAKYLLLMDENFTILEDKAICFDKSIKEIGDFEELKSRYSDAVVEDLKDLVLMPGLINTHVHLEFSDNQADLEFGDFLTWLKSVIQNRDDLLKRCQSDCIDKALDDIKRGGTTTIGAISSFGHDLKSCVKTPLNVVYFNEVLGSTPAAVDIIYNDFLERFEKSLSFKSDSFIPAISIHSPYSTHPILAQKVLQLARKKDLTISTHFMESDAERAWLDKGSGDFEEFFKTFLENPKPMISPLEYIRLFSGLKTLFTHCTKANSSEIKAILDQGGIITHCPRSNRYLGNGRLEIEKIEEFHLATDGLSSNDSLSLWDEMRGALMMHYKAPLKEFSKKLLKSVSTNPADALNLKKGRLEKGFDSDLIALKIPKGLKDKNQLALFLILHTKEAKSIYIRGEKLK